AGRLSISRTLQTVGGKPTEFGAKTRSSRRRVELDDQTIDILVAWRRRLEADRLPYGVANSSRASFVAADCLASAFMI
ncbi:MAG: hypothetical protein ACRD0M_05425, partial [Acidimicrobiales bacterium]